MSQVLNRLRILADIHINITSFHQKVLVSRLFFKSLVQIVQSLLVIFHESERLADSFVNASVF